MAQMQFSPPEWQYEEPASPPPPRCPRCGGPTRRTRRRVRDRVASLFGPLRRYRCGDLQCGWKGNRRLPREQAASRLPRSFLAGMAIVLLATAGAVAMTLHGPLFTLGDGLLRLFGVGTAAS